MFFLPEGTSPLCTNCGQKFVVKFVACSWIMLQNIIQNFLVDISPSRSILINIIFFSRHFFKKKKDIFWDYKYNAFSLTMMIKNWTTVWNLIWFIMYDLFYIKIGGKLLILFHLRFSACDPWFLIWWLKFKLWDWL